MVDAGGREGPRVGAAWGGPVTGGAAWHSAGKYEVPADPAWMDPALAARLATMRYTKRPDEVRLGCWTASPLWLELSKSIPAVSPR